MNRKILKTLDGSTTIFVEDMNEPYHSTNGAIQESVHVFVKSNLELMRKDSITIFELGFGTGLNALLAYRYAKQNNRKVKYVGIEMYPVELSLILQLNFCDFFTDNEMKIFRIMHEVDWNCFTDVDEIFSMKKLNCDFSNYCHTDFYDSVFFDAFDPNKQPELWDEHVFSALYQNMNAKSILTTYSAKGIVRRAMQSAGFVVERIPGAPGKREMLRANKH